MHRSALSVEHWTFARLGPLSSHVPLLHYTSYFRRLLSQVVRKQLLTTLAAGTESFMECKHLPSAQLQVPGWSPRQATRCARARSGPRIVCTVRSRKLINGTAATGHEHSNIASGRSGSVFVQVAAPAIYPAAGRRRPPSPDIQSPGPSIPSPIKFQDARFFPVVHIQNFKSAIYMLNFETSPDSFSALIVSNIAPLHFPIQTRPFTL